MKKKSSAVVILSLVLILIHCPLAWPHDTWLEESEDRVTVLVGHQGKTDPYEPERVVEIVGYTANGWAVPLEIERSKEGCSALVDEPFAAFTAILDNKYWLQTTEGWKNQREKQGLEIIIEGRSYKYTKHISAWKDFLSRPLGQRFELVPLKDPTGLKEGETLPVKIYFEGRPAAKAALAKTSNMKDTHELEQVEGEGPFTVTIGPPGPQLVNAKYVLPVKGEKQVVWFAGSLTFSTTKK